MLHTIRCSENDYAVIMGKFEADYLDEQRALMLWHNADSESRIAERYIEENSPPALTQLAAKIWQVLLEPCSEGRVRKPRTYDDLEFEANIARASVAKGIKELLKMEMVEKIPGGGFVPTNRYRLRESEKKSSD